MKNSYYGYVPNAKVRDPFISVSGWVLKGKDKGKKLSSVSTETLEWYLENLSLTKNEIYELEAELKKRK